MNGRVIGWTQEARVGSEVCVEVDLRSSEKEERTIRFIVDGKIQKCVIFGLGKKIRYGVWNNLLLLLFLYFYSIYIFFIIYVFYVFID